MKNEVLVPYQPLLWQIAPWRDKSPVLGLFGAAGGGKSRLAAEKIHGFLMKYPDAAGLIVRKTRESMVNSTVLFMEKVVIGRDPRVNHLKSEHHFEYSNGSMLFYGGMKDEDQREQIRSIGQEGKIDIAWMEEAVKFSEDDFQELMGRMRGTAAGWIQMILSSNPGPPSHWINQRLILGKEASIYTSTARDNPFNPPQYFETLDRLTGIMRQRLRDGLWVQAEGLVYENFDIGNITDDEPDPELPFELGFDDGYVDPRAILFIQRKPDRILVFDELYHSRHLASVCVDEVITKCGERYGWMNEEERLPNKLPDIAVGSPEAKELQERFRQKNIPVRGRPHEVTNGIDVVRDLICDGNNYRTLRVNKRVKNFISELTEGYQYPRGSHRSSAEKPLDKDDHACDAFRYWAFLRGR